ncbi:MAG: DUF1858 domain-containing protein [Clostridia bacterium]|nr:DUF1858 domain-containing protein [Clostridia bacterium]
MEKITKDTLIMDIVKINPESVRILQKYGMHCLGCALAHMETIEQAVGVHGVDLDALLEELNNLSE